MEIEIQDFQKDVIEESFKIPVLVDFWADWCGPCRILGPVLEKLAQKYSDKWKLIKINTEEFPEIAAKYGVISIPNVKLFHKGKVINEFVGALPEKMLEDWLRKSIPSKYSDMIEKAKLLLSNGKESDAKVILEEVHKGDITNSEAKILLSKILIFENPKEALRLIESSNTYDELVDLANSISFFAELFEKLQTPEKLPEHQVKSIYIEAIKQLIKKNFSQSLEKFIEVIREYKQYDDEGARKACIAIFKYLGEDNEITLNYRREFGRALYI
jgi:putative thioredoxin